MYVYGGGGWVGNYNYPTAVFFSSVYRFSQDLNKVVD